MDMHETKRLKQFWFWLGDPAQGIELHPSLTIEAHGNMAGYGVFASSDIPAGEIVMKVPKTALLSSRSCAIANLLQDSDIDGMLGICLSFLFERAQGKHSPWHAYIEMCPVSVPISKLWSKDQQSVLKGTEVAMVGGTTLSDFKDRYKDEVRPFLKTHAAELAGFSKLSFESFCEGMSIVGSRAFEVDAYHGLAMCPFADMLDHDITENVHFETNYDVCPECGAAGGCEHDPDSEDEQDEDDKGDSGEGSEDGMSQETSVLRHDDLEVQSEEGSETDEADTCDFIVHRALRSGDQVFNTYGDCGNDVLLARYGFALPDNPHDRISLGPELSGQVMSKVHQDWWDLNGVNLMAALRKSDSLPPTNDCANSSDPSTDEDDDDSFMRADDESNNGTTADDDDDDDEESLTDACYLDARGLPSPTLLVYLCLATLSAHALQAKSGPEVRATLTLLLATWRYVRPGRMPLPRYLFTDACTALLEVTGRLRALIVARDARYRMRDVLALDMDAAVLEKLKRAVVGMTTTMSEDDTRRRFAMIVRINELEIMRRGLDHLALVENACRWLISRGNN